MTAFSQLQNAITQAHPTMHNMHFYTCVVFSELAVEVGPQKDWLELLYLKVETAQWYSVTALT